MRLAVYDEGGHLLGQRILPMEQLRPGYRHITLRNEANMPLPLATLYCKLDLKTYTPEALSGFADALAGLSHFFLLFSIFIYIPVYLTSFFCF